MFSVDSSPKVSPAVCPDGLGTVGRDRKAAERELVYQVNF
jgi:hypothetical protein